MQLNNASFSHGRIISNQMNYDPVKNRGLNAQGVLGRLISWVFGSGTIKVQVGVGNDHYYLNRESCANLVGGDRRAFLQLTDQEMLKRVQGVFDTYLPANTVERKETIARGNKPKSEEEDEGQIFTREKKPEKGGDIAEILEKPQIISREKCLSN